jgi:nitrous oxidase accessory protein NosD
MKATLRRALSACVLAGSLALALALAAGAGSAEAKSSVVGPGESIQKAVNAADPGDTIVVKGVHREDVIICKDGIKLRGEDAVIEAPTKANADSPCSRTFGTEAICVVGDVNLETLRAGRWARRDVSVSGFTFRGFEIAGKGVDNNAYMIDAGFARNATVVGNRLIGNVAGGINVGGSIDTTVAKNRVIGSPSTSISAIDVGNVNRNTKVLNNEVRNIPEDHNAIEVDENSIDTTVAGNDLENDWVGVVVEDAPGTKILSNVVSRFGIVGAFVAGQESANTQVVGNDISGGPWGVFVTDAHRGSFVGNEVHDNFAGMFFEAFEPVGGFEVKANTVEDNTRSCRGAKFGRSFSGIGIALLGASGVEVTANRLSGNVPSGPTRISGGDVVSTDLYFGVTAKPKNDSVIANRFGRNKPDLYWDVSGTGNVFRANYCDASVPSRLCD